MIVMAKKTKNKPRNTRSWQVFRGSRDHFDFNQRAMPVIAPTVAITVAIFSHVAMGVSFSTIEVLSFIMLYLA